MIAAQVARWIEQGAAHLQAPDRYILLVEDNPGDARLTQALLDEPGGVPMPPLRWVQSIESAIQTLSQAPPCIAVLLDLGLPGSQGLDALHALQPALAASPLIVLTSDESDSVGMASVAAGAQDFLVKGSFDGALLRRCIGFAGQRKRAELALINQALAAQLASEASDKRLQNALRLSELRYRLAAAQGQVWDWDPVAGRVSFPAAFWRLMGCEPPPDPEHAARFEALLHPDDVAPWRAALRAHLARRQPYQLEYRARHADGGWHWFQTQGQAVWNAQGRATYMAGTTFEITERKQAEIALRESETYRRQLFEQLADGVLLIDRQLRLHDANPQALAMLGYRRDELLRLTAADLLPGFEQQRLAPEVAAMMSGQPHLADWELLRKDGTRFPAEVNARALDDQRFLAVLRDISVRRAAEQALLGFQFELSQLAQRLLTQEKATTQRVAQALHDHLGQTLAVARLKLDACVAVHAAQMPAALKSQAEQISLLLDQAVREVRQVLADLRPPLLEEQGLAAALDNEIRSRGVVASGADVLLFDHTPAVGQRWPPAVEYAAFMVGREAITNARQHAGAALIRVVLDGSADTLQLDVVDDGCGIAQPLARGRPGHLGMVGMRERAIAIGARFEVLQEPSGGTCISLRWQAVVE